MPVPITRSLKRVDRIHRIAGRDQRLHPRTPIGLNPDQYLRRPDSGSRWSATSSWNRLIPANPSGNRPCDQPATRLVDNLNVVMGLSPVISHE